jgi:hypothetical protein
METTISVSFAVFNGVQSEAGNSERANNSGHNQAG